MSDLRLECLKLAVGMASTYDEAIRTANRMYVLLKDGVKASEIHADPLVEADAADPPLGCADAPPSAYAMRELGRKLPVLEASINVASLQQKMLEAADKLPRKPLKGEIAGALQFAADSNVIEAALGGGERPDAFSNLQRA